MTLEFSVLCISASVVCRKVVSNTPKTNLHRKWFSKNSKKNSFKFSSLCMEKHHNKMWKSESLPIGNKSAPQSLFVYVSGEIKVRRMSNHGKGEGKVCESKSKGVVNINEWASSLGPRPLLDPHLERGLANESITKFHSKLMFFLGCCYGIRASMCVRRTELSSS